MPMVMPVTSYPNITPDKYYDVCIASVRQLTLWECEEGLSVQEQIGRKQAGERIMICFDKQQDILDLSNLSLSSLPSLPEQITKLNIKDNKLSSLDNIPFKNLTTLDASNNIIKGFPSIIPKKLIHLNLSNNCIRFIPDVYRQMDNKAIIDMKFNPLTFRNVAELKDGQYNNEYPIEGQVIHVDENKETNNNEILEFIKGVLSYNSYIMFFCMYSDIRKENEYKSNMLLYFVEYLLASVDRRNDIEIIETIERSISEAFNDKEFITDLIDTSIGAIKNCHQNIYKWHYDLMMLLLRKDVEGRKCFAKNIHGVHELLENINDILYKATAYDVMCSDKFFDYLYSEPIVFIIEKEKIFKYILGVIRNEKNKINQENEIIEKCLRNRCYLNNLFHKYFCSLELHKKTFTSSPWQKFSSTYFPCEYAGIIDKLEKDENYYKDLLCEMAKHKGMESLMDDSLEFVGRKSGMLLHAKNTLDDFFEKNPKTAEYLASYGRKQSSGYISKGEH